MILEEGLAAEKDPLIQDRIKARLSELDRAGAAIQFGDKGVGQIQLTDIDL